MERSDGAAAALRVSTSLFNYVDVVALCIWAILTVLMMYPEVVRFVSKFKEKV
jgi:hypothetical protein